MPRPSKKKNHPTQTNFSDPHSILDNAPIGIFTSTPDGRFLSANPALAEMLGYDSPEELIESVTDIAEQLYADPEDRKEFIRLLEEHGEVANHECRMHRRDGTEFWGASKARVVRDQGGYIVAYQGFTTDISIIKYLQEELEQRLVELRKSRTAFKKEELRRRILMDNSLDGIAIIDQNHRVLEANKSFAQMLGYTQQEVLGLHTWNWEARLTEEQIRASFSDLADIKAIFETRHQRKDGSTFDVEVSATGVELAGQNVIMTVCRDITERKRTEEKQAKSREMLLQAEVLAKLGCLEWDIPRDVWSVSDNWRCIMGHHAPRLSSSELFAYVSPEDRWRVKRAIATTMRTGEPYSIQHRILRGDTGEVRHVQTYGVVEFNKSGKPVLGFGAVLDITERKQAEQALRESEERYRLLFEHSPLGVMHANEKGIITACNNNFVQIIGSSRQALVGLNMLNLPDKKLVAELEKALHGGIGFYEDVYHSATSSKSTPVKVHFAPILEKERNVRGCVGIVEDITDSKWAEEKLRVSEEKYRSLMEQSADMMYLHDLQGNILEVNQAAVSTTGYLKKELLNMSAFNLYPDQSTREDIIRQWKQWKPGYSMTLEYVHIRKDGGQIPMEVTPCKVSFGGKEYIMAFVHDIAERKRAREEQEKLQAQLFQAQKMESVGVLAGGVAHDFNNLLHAMGGNLELLDRKIPEDHPGKKRIPTIQKSMNRAAHLVKQMLLFSRKARTQRQDMDLNQEVQHAAEMLERTIPKMVSIELDLDNEAWTINADPVQVEQVLLNLGSNAADAMPDGGMLIIETSNVDVDEALANEHTGLKKGEYVLMSVSDTGCGMDEEALDKVFDPFFTTKEVGKGTGLGLASAYGIVKAHEGYITCQSQPGKGTTFKIYWPAVNTKLDND